MASIDITAGSGTHVATNAITRDGITEHMQLANVADPATAKCVSVTDAGTTGIQALAAQGVTGGVPMGVSMRGAQFTAVIAPGATTTLRASAGRFYGMAVTSDEDTALRAVAYDQTSATGTPLGRCGNTKDDSNTPANGVPFVNGLTVQSPAGGPSVTVFWSAETT